MEEIVKISFVVGLLMACATSTGCAVPLLTGLKSVQTSSGARYEFMTGADFSIGAQGYDRVEDRRGIHPRD